MTSPQTIAGITFTRNKDGSVTLNGTSTGFGQISLYSNSSKSLVNENTTYTLYSGQKTQNIFVYAFEYYNNTWNQKTNSAKIGTYTPTGQALGQRFDLAYVSGATFNNETIYPMLVKGTYTLDTIGEYEPYQSQTYPIYLGVENLFDKNGTLTNGYLKADGTTQSASGYKVSDYINISQFSDITISGNDGGNEVNCFYDSSKAFVSYFSMGSSKTITKVVPSNAKYMRCTIKEANLDIYQLEKGTKANSYSEYGTTPIELCKIGDYQDYFTKNSGKNLFDISTSETKKYVRKSDGTIQNSNDWTATDYIEVKPSQSYIYSGITNGASGNAGTSFYDETKTFISSINSTEQTFTTPSNAKSVRISLNTETPTRVMLNEGSTALPYEPYGTGQWCKYNAIGKVVLDGSEAGWSSPSTNRFNLDGVIQYIKARDTKNYFSTHYVAYNQKDTNADFNTLVSNVNSAFDLSSGTGIFYTIRIKDTNYSSLETYKTWLSSNNVSVYYVLSSPYLSLIEDTTLINQLDNIQNAMSYEGTTNIGQVNNDKPFIISAKALEQGSNEVVVNNIGNTYSKPTIALEGIGDINIYLNGTQMLKATLTDKMTIDTTNLEAYNPDTMTLLNRQLVGDISKFKLDSGNNTIKMDGALTKATITDYVRYL